MNAKHPPGDPMTLGNMRHLGVRGLAVHCLNPKCRHLAVFSADDYPDEVPVPFTHVTSPPPQSHYFLAKAAECLDRSLAVPDREYQRLYCELAGQWLILRF